MLVVFTIIFYACGKNDKLEQGLSTQSSERISIKEARAGFDQFVKTANPSSILNSAPNKYFDILQWEKASIEMGSNNVAYCKVPLVSKGNVKITHVYHNAATGKTNKSTLPHPWLLIYKDSSKNVRILVLQSVPTSADPQSSVAAEKRGFKGETRVYDWNGRLQYGFIYEDGKKIKQINPVVRRKANSLGRWEEQCIPYKRCSWQSGCNFQYGYPGPMFEIIYYETEGLPYCDQPLISPEGASYRGDASCDGWSLVSEEDYDVCELMWVDDDPDPDPGWAGSEYGYPYEWWLDDLWLSENFFLQQQQQLTAAERALVHEYPIYALMIRDNAVKARTMTISKFGTNGLNDRSDAFRHAFFNCLNAQQIGAAITKLFSDAHEAVPVPIPLERTMDIFNNDVGIAKSALGFGTDSELSDRIWNTLWAGELRYLSPLDHANHPHGIIPGVTAIIPTNQ